VSTEWGSDQAQVAAFCADNDKGLKHSLSVLETSLVMVDEIGKATFSPDDLMAIEHLCLFHDIGKFFQELHSLENTNIACDVYKQYGANRNIPENVIAMVVDGIVRSDFYNLRLFPSGQPPKSLAGDIVRCSDKMQDNLVAKVDRYWFEYGVPRGATFYKRSLSREERGQFSFENFKGDQLNVILSIISLSGQDFSHPVLQATYDEWSKQPKELVVERIIALANEIGCTPSEVSEVESIINWYRSEFAC
jgi:HD superfamily phosphodiesterase